MDSKFTFWKYKDNFDPYEINVVERGYSVQDENSTAWGKSTQFQCDFGKVTYTVSSFPSNCGIAIYHNVYFNPNNSLNSDKELYREFNEFIRRTSPNSMIMMTDRKSGNIARFISNSSEEYKWNTSGHEVKNTNSEYYIKVWTTERYSDSSHYIPMRHNSFYYQYSKRYEGRFKAFADS